MLGKAFGAVAALEKERRALGRLGELGLQRARLAGEDERRVERKRLLRRGQGRPVGGADCVLLSL